MDVVGHDSVGLHFDGEKPRKLPQPLADPGAAVLVVPPRVGIAPTEEGAPHTTRNAVENAAHGGVDQEPPRSCHVSIMFK
jgi:hypothetical protein